MVRLENLIYACNAVMPTFLLILLGMGLKKIGILTEDFIRQGNRLCFQVLFPIMVFFNLYEAEEIDIAYAKLIFLAVSIILISLSVLMLTVPRRTERRRAAVLIQSIYRGNFMLYGLPFSQTLGGTAAVSMATSILAVTLPLLNIIGVFVYSYFGEQAASLKETAVHSMKNPIIWGVLLGAIAGGLSLSLPTFLYTAGKDAAKIGTPFAFLLLGGQFRLSSAVKNRKALAAGLFVKLIFLPALVLWAAIGLFGITGSALVPLFIFAAAPTAITNYQMAVQFDADAELAGDFLIYSMLFSIITMFGFIYILRTCGWI